MHFGKKLGFVHDVETHDPDFDKEFLCSSSNKSMLLNLLSRMEVKQAVRDIFSKGFIILKANGNFFISKPDYKMDTDVTIENITIKYNGASGIDASNSYNISIINLRRILKFFFGFI